MNVNCSMCIGMTQKILQISIDALSARFTLNFSLFSMKMDNDTIEAGITNICLLSF